MAIGLDIGSSSVKAVLLDGRGRARLVARRAIATRRGTGGRVEHDGDAIARAAVAALAAAARRAPGDDLGIATQRSTVIFWDRDTGRPLTPAYSWQDLRGRAFCERLRRARGGVETTIARRTGLRLSAHYAAAKLAWALRHVRGLRRAVARGRALWGPLGTFLLWRLTGGSAYAVDHANAQRTLLLDLEGLRWDLDLVRIFGLDPLADAPALPALVPTCFDRPVPIAIGGQGGLRLRALTGDQQAALLGLGCRGSDDVAINYGSGAFVLRHVGPRPVRSPGLLTTLLLSWRPPGEPSRVAARYALEGPVNAAATAIAWARRRLGVRVPLARLDAWLGPPALPAAVHFLPAVAGVGAPRWDARARPRFHGARDAGSRERMRAVVASIAFRCAEIYRAGAPVARGGGRRAVAAAGGLTRCRTLLQAQADLLQRPLVVREVPDASAIGAALLARPGEPRRAPRASAGANFTPRMTRLAAEARYRAWSGAVYGTRGRAGVAPGRGAAAR